MNVPLTDVRGNKTGVFHFKVREHVEEGAPAPEPPVRPGCFLFASSLQDRICIRI